MGTHDENRGVRELLAVPDAPLKERIINESEATMDALDKIAETPASVGKTITLSGGQVATFREAKGRDLEKGATVARDATNPMSLFMGVVAQVTEIDGKPVAYEDLQDLPLGDVLALIGAVGGNVASPALGSLSGSPA